MRSTGSKVEKMHDSKSIMAISKVYFFTLKKESRLKTECTSIKNSQWIAVCCGFLPPPPPVRRELAAFTMASVSKRVIFPSHIDTFLFNSGAMECTSVWSLFPKVLETAIRNEIWLTVPVLISLTFGRSAAMSVASVWPIYTHSWHPCIQIDYCLLG